MKKPIVAVQTFWKSQSNYGQILQGYALQKFLSNNGYNSYIIRFDSLFSKIKEFFSCILTMRWRYFQLRTFNKKRQFKSFKKRMNFSKNKYNTLKSLIKNPPKADCYFTGSDQVWAYMRNLERRKAYLLDFTKDTAKFAYAASFGRDSLNNDEISMFSKCLRDYNFVGVREESGMEICNSLHIISYWVTDPVSLITRDEWEKLISPCNRIKKNKRNIFIYTLSSFENLKPIIPQDNVFNCNYTNPNEINKQYQDCTPTIEEWLSLIYHSDFVLTDSFHCMMFCIIFQKNFVIFNRLKGEKMNNRITSFLKRIGLSDRFVNVDNINLNLHIDKIIEWESVSKRFNSWVEESKDLLLSMLSVINFK